MAKLSWGKPKVEFTAAINGAPAIGAVWTPFPEIRQDTAKLATTKGNKKEAPQEGGGIVDVRYELNKYLFELEIFVKKGDSKPIDDTDGLIASNYAVRLTPEDEACEGFILENCVVTVEESYAAADGKVWKYSFDAIKPASGNILKAYTANNLVITPSALYFSDDADATGKTLTAASTGDLTAASSSEDWATVTKAGKVATVKVTANEGATVRTAVITLTADGNTSYILVSQIPA